MKKRIVWRSCLISLCAVLIVFCASVGVIYANSRSAVKKNLTEEIAVYAALVKDNIHALEKVPSFGETRITIVGLDGAVLFDSKASGLPEANHLEREEIRAALSGKPAFVERFSSTLGYRMMYYAIKVNGPTPFVLRIAERSSNFWAYVGGSVPFVLLAMLLALGLSYVLARQLSAKVAGQMREVCESLRSIGKNDYRPIKADMSDTETYSVLEEINLLSDELRSSYERADEERSKLDFVANHVTQGIVALDARGKLVYVNSVARTLFNATELGKHYIYLFDDQGFYTNVRDRLNGGDSTFAYSYRGADLSVRLLNVADAELSREISVMLIVSDVTKENAALRQKAEFFANASHELKTPLTSMQGLSELLLVNADPTSKKQLERIHTESKRLNALVLDMLYISNLENHALVESKIQVELGKVVAQVVEEYRTEIEEKKISVSICGRADIYADVRQMAELIGNLIGNAVHYNKSGGAVSVALTESGDTVRMTVVDTGIGIPAEHIPKLCERFYRVDKSRSKKTGGTGLGLAIVKHIALSYGGGIEIASAENVGTTVIVTLSKANPENRELQALEAGAAEH